MNVRLYLCILASLWCVRRATIKMCAYYPWSSEYTKKKKNTNSKLIFMRMLNVKQDKVGHEGLLLAKFGPEDMNKHCLQNILVMLRRQLQRILKSDSLKLLRQSSFAARWHAIADWSRTLGGRPRHFLLVGASTRCFGTCCLMRSPNLCDVFPTYRLCLCSKVKRQRWPASIWLEIDNLQGTSKSMSCIFRGSRKLWRGLSESHLQDSVFIALRKRLLMFIKLHLFL